MLSFGILKVRLNMWYSSHLVITQSVWVYAKLFVTPLMSWADSTKYCYSTNSSLTYQACSLWDTLEVSPRRSHISLASLSSSEHSKVKSRLFPWEGTEISQLSYCFQCLLKLILWQKCIAIYMACSYNKLASLLPVLIYYLVSDHLKSTKTMAWEILSCAVHDVM